MPITIRKIQDHMELLAPSSLAEEWDNVGLLIGDVDAQASRVLVALDASASVVAQAEMLGTELIIVHHPLLFSPIKQLVEDGGVVSLARQLIRNRCGLIVCHTNLDSAPRGLNSHVGELLGVLNMSPLLSNSGLGRIGTLATPVTLATFATLVAKALHTDTLKVLGNPQRLISTVALCTGAGDDLFTDARAAGADVFISSEIKHHTALLARDADCAIIDGGHYPTERPAVTIMAAHLRRLTGIDVIEAVEDDPWRSALLLS